MGEPGVELPHERAALWADDRHLVAQLSNDGASPWRLFDLHGKARPLAYRDRPLAFLRAADGRLVALSDGALLRLDPVHAGLDPIARLGGTAQVFLPQDPGKPSNRLLVGLSNADGFQGIATVSTMSGETGALYHPPDPMLIDADLDRGMLLFRASGRDGMVLRLATIPDGDARELLHLDRFMADIDWGATRLIDYRGEDGQALKGAVILPPGYRAGKRYPTLVWVYGGHMVRSLDGDYWLDPFMPGIYNLQLYAARGYVVLVPSMPLPRREGRRDVSVHLTTGVLPAIDRLVELGIADPDRLGVFGQSFGGYSVYALVARTDRFKAAVAMAGITDLASHYGQFDPLARGYPGIAHEMSDNWAEMPIFGEQVAPWLDPTGYARNSPLTYVDRVHTPLLMIHGSLDMRGASAQAEQFFYALYQQGKTARLLRYGGESHSLANSPANVRDIFTQTVGWFDTYLRPPSED